MNDAPARRGRIERSISSIVSRLSVLILAALTKSARLEVINRLLPKARTPCVGIAETRAPLEQGCAEVGLAGQPRWKRNAAEVAGVVASLSARFEVVFVAAPEPDSVPEREVDRQRRPEAAPQGRLRSLDLLELDDAGLAVE